MKLHISDILQEQRLSYRIITNPAPFQVAGQLLHLRQIRSSIMPAKVYAEKNKQVHIHWETERKVSHMCIQIDSYTYIYIYHCSDWTQGVGRPIL